MTAGWWIGLGVLAILTALAAVYFIYTDRLTNIFYLAPIAIVFLYLVASQWAGLKSIDGLSGPSVDIGRTLGKIADYKAAIDLGGDIFKKLQTTIEAGLFLKERKVELLFASNREPVQGPDGPDMNGERAKKLTFGAARVNIPDDAHHKVGQIELPLKANWIKLRFADETPDPKKHFIVEHIGFFEKDKFVETARAFPAKTAIVFVHGFNTTFREGVLRFSQIVWDLQYGGLPVLFSWPSMSGIDNYAYDLNSARGAVDHFKALLGILRDEAGITGLHVIAHSMGNVVVLQSLKELALVQKPSVVELVMAAPDVDMDEFDGLMEKAALVTRGMTLYASSTDWAMVASRKVNKKGRAGDIFPAGPLVAPKLDSIDVSAIGDEMFGLNHSTFASDRSLVEDINRLIRKSERPPHQRSATIRGIPEGQTPPTYWRYAK